VPVNPAASRWALAVPLAAFQQVASEHCLGSAALDAPGAADAVIKAEVKAEPGAGEAGWRAGPVPAAEPAAVGAMAAAVVVKQEPGTAPAAGQLRPATQAPAVAAQGRRSSDGALVAASDMVVTVDLTAAADGVDRALFSGSSDEGEDPRQPGQQQDQGASSEDWEVAEAGKGGRAACLLWLAHGRCTLGSWPAPPWLQSQAWLLSTALTAAAACRWCCCCRRQPARHAAGIGAAAALAGAHGGAPALLEHLHRLCHGPQAGRLGRPRR
jgi:hypothetical protein